MSVKVSTHWDSHDKGAAKNVGVTEFVTENKSAFWVDSV